MGFWVQRGLHVEPSSTVEKKYQKAQAGRSERRSRQEQTGANRSKEGAGESKRRAERARRREFNQQNITWHFHLGVYIYCETKRKLAK